MSISSMNGSNGPHCLDDKAFYYEQHNFLGELKPIWEQRMERGGGVPPKVIGAPPPKYEKVGRFLYSDWAEFSAKGLTSFDRLHNIHQEIRRDLLSAYPERLPSLDSFVDEYLYFEWIQNFNPQTSSIKRDHYSHVTKTMFCGWKIKKVLDGIRLASGKTMTEHLIECVSGKFERFLYKNKRSRLSGIEPAKLALEIFYLSAFLHDKGTVFEVLNDLRSRVISIFDPLWDERLFIYGGARGGRSRNKYSVICNTKGRCSHKENCVKHYDCSDADKNGYRFLREFLKDEKVFGKKYWEKLLRKYVGRGIPRRINDSGPNDYHGFYSALELISANKARRESSRKSKDWAEREFIFSCAAQAMILHDLEDIEIDVDNEPMAFLLYLADQCQQWGRQKINFDNLLSERELNFDSGGIERILLLLVDTDGDFEKPKLRIQLQIQEGLDESKKRDLMEDINEANEKISRRLRTLKEKYLDLEYYAVNDRGARV